MTDTNQIKGTNVAAPIVPFDRRDVFPTHYAKYGAGGFISVNTVAELNAIPSARLEEGMRARVLDDSDSANNGDWEYVNGAWSSVYYKGDFDSAIAEITELKTSAEEVFSNLTEQAAFFYSVSEALLASPLHSLITVPDDNSPIESLNLYKLTSAGDYELVVTYPSVKDLEKVDYIVPFTFYVTNRPDLAYEDAYAHDVELINQFQSNPDKFKSTGSFGSSLTYAFYTVSAALKFVSENVAPLEAVIIVHPGEYWVEPFTLIPRNCTLYGYDLRSTVLKLLRVYNSQNITPDGSGKAIMFLMSNGIKVRGFTFKGLEHEEFYDIVSFKAAINGAGLINTSESRFDVLDDYYDKMISENVDGTPEYGDWYPQINQYTKKVEVEPGKEIDRTWDDDYPPAFGFVFAFNPGEWIDRSPYIADCSQLHSFTYTELTKPISRKASFAPDIDASPFDPDSKIWHVPNHQFGKRGGGNMIVDGSILHKYSPLRSVVVDSFTAINPNGYGYIIKKNAFVQLVSVFTNWSRIGLWSLDGGHVTVANSNNTFGDIALAATGYRKILNLVDLEPEDLYDYFTSPQTTIITEDDFNGQHLVQGQLLIDDADESYDTFDPNDPSDVGLSVLGLSGYASPLVKATMAIWAQKIQDDDSGRIPAGFKSHTDITGFDADSPGSWSNYYKRSAYDFSLLITDLGYDLISGGTSSVRSFIQGLFNWDGKGHIDYTHLNTISTGGNLGGAIASNANYIYTYQLAYEALLEACTNSASFGGAGSFTVDSAAYNKVKVLVGYIIRVLESAIVDSSNDFYTIFPSVVEATGQQFSYVGAGVNYNSLPNSQRRTGQAVDPKQALYKYNGGRIYATFASEVGDSYLGEDLRIDFERSTVEGQAFSRGVQNISLPLTIAVSA